MDEAQRVGEVIESSSTARRIEMGTKGRKNIKKPKKQKIKKK